MHAYTTATGTSATVTHLEATSGSQNKAGVSRPQRTSVRHPDGWFCPSSSRGPMTGRPAGVQPQVVRNPPQTGTVNQHTSVHFVTSRLTAAAASATLCPHPPNQSIKSPAQNGPAPALHCVATLTRLGAQLSPCTHTFTCHQPMRPGVHRTPPLPARLPKSTPKLASCELLSQSPTYIRYHPRATRLMLPISGARNPQDFEEGCQQRARRGLVRLVTRGARSGHAKANQRGTTPPRASSRHARFPLCTVAVGLQQRLQS